MRTHDFVAIGIGPFNLGLACLTDPIEELDGVFLDRSPEFDWHPGMMLEASTLQTPFLADLVTLADPTSPFSFLNYTKQSGHLYAFYIRESFHPLRSEYNDYCRWAAAQLDTLRWGCEVHAVGHDGDAYLVHTSSDTYRARHLVLGTGTPPHIPAGAGDLGVHSAEFALSCLNRLQLRDSRQMVDLADPAGSLQLVGTLDNPLRARVH